MPEYREKAGRVYELVGDEYVQRPNLRTKAGAVYEPQGSDFVKIGTLSVPDTSSADEVTLQQQGGTNPQSVSSATQVGAPAPTGGQPAAAATPAPSAPVAAEPVPSAPPPVAPISPLENINPVGFAEELFKGLYHGVPSTLSNIAGGAQAAANVVGATGVGETLGQVSQATKSENPNAPTLRKVLNQEAGLLPYTGAVLGQGLATMGALAGAAAAGAYASGPALAGTLAAGLGLLMNSGELYNNLREKGVDAPGAAIAAGIPMTALDVIEPLRLSGGLRKEILQEAVAQATKAGTVKVVGKSALTEGGTEMGQEGISVGVEAGYGLNPDVLWRLVEAGIGGMLTGGTLKAGQQGMGLVVSTKAPQVLEAELEFTAEPGPAIEDDIKDTVVATPEGPALASSASVAAQEAREVLAELPDGDPDMDGLIVEGISEFGAQSHKFLQLRQLGWKYPNFAPLQALIQAADRMNAMANSIKLQGDLVLENWRALGNARSRLLTDFALDATLLSDRLKRKLTDTELATLAGKRKLDDATFAAYRDMTKFFDLSIQQLKDATIADIIDNSPNPQVAEAKIAVVELEFKKFANRTYFPLARFGQFTVTAKRRGYVDSDGTVKKGKVLRFETFETAREARLAKAVMEKEFGGQPVDVGTDELIESVRQASQLPLAALGKLTDQLQLSQDQIEMLSDVIGGNLPGRSFLHRLRRRRGTPGFSRDGQRAFAAYTQSVANHIARLHEERHLQKAVDEAGAIATKIRQAGGDAIATRKLQDRMQQQKNFMMNPKGQNSALAGGLFFWFFSYVPKQALVNTLQIPGFTYPLLTKQLGVVEGTRQMVSAMKDTTHLFTKRMFNKGKYIGSITPMQWEAIERAQAEGYLEQGFAAQVAALAQTTYIEKTLTSIWGPVAQDVSRSASEAIDRVVSFGAKPFQASEEYNRFVTFLAVYRGAEKQGGADPYTVAKDAVNQTQGSYEAFNRAPIAQGNLQTAFIFKNYLMNALWFYRNHPAGRRALLAQAAMGGLLALPGAEDLLDLLDMLGTWGKEFFGMKNPRIDLRHEMRELVNALVGTSDWFMHGPSRLPQSLFDISSSISMGRILPGVRPATSKLKGDTKNWDSTALALLEELSGVAGAQSMNMMKAVMDPGPDGDAWRRVLLPSVLRNMDQTQQAMRQGQVKTITGDKLVDVDLDNPWHMAELVGMVAGLTPSRISRQREENFAPRMVIQYYTIRQEAATARLERALASKDDAAITAATKEIIDLQGIMPAGMGRTVKSIRQGLRSREKSRTLREMGLPTQRRLFEISEEYRQAVR